MLKLRDYQNDGEDRIRASYASGRRAPLYVLPTGGGKTTLFTDMAMKASSKGTRTGIIVHRKELLDQASKTLGDMGVKHGIIAPGFRVGPELVQVASIQTLIQRAKTETINLDFLIYDEAHHVGAQQWQTCNAMYPKAKILGVTATACRLDGKGLGVRAGGIFDDLIVGPSIRELIDLGWLVQPRVFAPPSQLDLSTVKRTSSGDFNANDLWEKKSKLTGCEVEHYSKMCPGLPAVVFCVNILHAEFTCRKFVAAGFRFEIIHGKLKPEVRKRIVDDLRSGKLQGIVSVDIVSEGFDCPRLKCAILLRETMSLSLYLQQVGRVLRPTDDKGDAFILDHAGNCLRHGLPDDDGRLWTLDGAMQKAKKQEDVIRIRQCEKCFAVFEFAPECPECGHVNKTKERKIEHVEGQLTEITREQAAMIKQQKEVERKQARSNQGQAQSLEDLKRIAKEKGYHPKWAERVFNARRRS